MDGLSICDVVWKKMINTDCHIWMELQCFGSWLDCNVAVHKELIFYFRRSKWFIIMHLHFHKIYFWMQMNENRLPNRLFFSGCQRCMNDNICWYTSSDISSPHSTVQSTGEICRSVEFYCHTCCASQSLSHPVSHWVRTTSCHLRAVGRLENPKGW